MIGRRRHFAARVPAAFVFAFCLLFAVPGQAAKAPKKKPAAADEPKPAAPDAKAVTPKAHKSEPAAMRPPVIPTPAGMPEAAPAAAPGLAPTPAEQGPRPPAVSPFGNDGARDAVADRTLDLRPIFEGFFLNFNVGYASSGGTAGPAIPETTPPISVVTQIGPIPIEKYTFAQWRDVGCTKYGPARCYAKGVTTDVGSGMAAALQVGYNIKGYVSLWADFSFHGHFGSKVDMAGNGTVAAMLGIHPLRFVQDGQLPVDVRLYGGYGFFDILYYYETQFQDEATGKAWTGTSIPFGLATEYKFDKRGVFAIGADLRFVSASYSKWIFNNDKDIASTLPSPHTTFRFEPRLVLGWHF